MLSRVNNSGKFKSSLISIVLTVFVITTLILVGPASALTVNLTTPTNLNPNKGDIVTFKSNVDIQTSEKVPITKLKITIKNSTDTIDCFFSMNGLNNTCSGFLTITVNVVNAVSDYGYGYANYSGYGYNWNKGYGYGYNGYGYASPNANELEYSFSLDTSDMSGSYTVSFAVITKASLLGKSQFDSATNFNLNVNPTSTPPIYADNVITSNIGLGGETNLSRYNITTIVVNNTTPQNISIPTIIAQPNENQTINTTENEQGTVVGNNTSTTNPVRNTGNGITGNAIYDTLKSNWFVGLGIIVCIIAIGSLLYVYFFKKKTA